MLQRIPHTTAVMAIMAAFAFLISPSAWAAGDPDELLDSLTAEEEAKVISLIDEGQQKYDDGEFQQALDIFNELYNIFPHPDVNYRVALCYERLGEDEMAVQHYRQFLEQVPDAEERGRVEGTIATLERRIGDASSTLRVETFPIGAQIFVDDPDTAPVGETPQSIQLAPGESYELIVKKEGYETMQRTVSVARGENTVMQLTMIEDGGAPAEVGGVSRWKPVGSVVMVGAGGVALFQARGHRSKYHEIKDTSSTRPIEDRDVMIREKNLAKGMGALGGATLLGAAAFTTWWIVGRRSEATRQFGLTPQPHGFSFVVSSQF